ncbi:hypothetical protein QLL95_gp1084 [Cotonvirus japonicus]|uniref:Uncharacterized protein n=1 Tax=Cotonvirus japonicus TaxID=2811091 RepID=A0ABM7NSB1_9VIRU|nr:hypothetical protein QLL95_gp1084 [Cotonvirus japonicus]BCS83039.1 hypothetical protein [Cotonvirus japonicus]
MDLQTCEKNSNNLNIFNKDIVGTYNMFYEELTNLNPVFMNLKQLYFNNSENDHIPIITNMFGVNVSFYTKENSLLLSTESDYYCEFFNGKPKYLVKYKLLIGSGSSKNASDSIGYIPICDGKLSALNCNFNGDFFKFHPQKIINYVCDNSSCDYIKNVEKYGKWCTKCGGDFDTAEKIFSLVKSHISLAEIPCDSILYVRKYVEDIDYDNVESLKKVQKFLQYDKEKIDNINERIENADERIRLFVSAVQEEKRYNTEIFNKILSSRGGTINEYYQTINEINEKINKNFET